MQNNRDTAHNLCNVYVKEFLRWFFLLENKQISRNIQ